VLVRHDRKPQLTQVVQFEAQVLPLKRRATWAKRVLLEQYLAVTLPPIRRRLHMCLLGSLLVCTSPPTAPRNYSAGSVVQGYAQPPAR
jgi:hypothetical protein